MTLLTSNNLTLQYDGRPVVEHLSFAVEAGDCLCVVGENGSGKSTLLRCILGQKKPDGGSLTFGDGLTRSQIGYLPQQHPAQKDFPATVEEIVRTGLLGRRAFSPRYSKEEKAAAARAMQAMELAGLEKAPFPTLSGGQQQRVLLARALTAARRMLVLDEPAAGLDPVVTAELYRAIERQNRAGMTVLMVSHDIPSALSMASRILHLANGDYFFGRPAEYAASPLGRRFTGEAAI